MEQVFREQREETERDHGFGALLQMWWITILDIFRMAPREHLSVLSQDLRYAARMMQKNISFTLAAVLILGLGIGANTAIFSVVNSVLLKPLPYQDGDRLVVLRQQARKLGIDDAQFSVKEFHDYRAQNRSLTGLVEYHNMDFSLYGHGETYRVRTGVVSPEFFDFFGIRPLMGRTFVAADDLPGAQPVLVLSYEFWKQMEGGDPNIVGKKYEMNDKTHIVIGVLPPIPQYPNENDVYMPTSSCPFRSGEKAISTRDLRFVSVFGRLKPGETLEHCHSDISAISSHMQQDDPAAYPKDSGFDVTASFLREDLTKNARSMLLLLLGAAAFVLLIACANVANLILARMARREQELMIRRAMGAGSGRILRQLLTESFLLALLAAGVGLFFASGTLQLLTDFASQLTPRAREITIDRGVLAFAILCASATTIVFGSVAALHFSRDLSSGLKEAGRSGMERRSNFIRSFLISAQVAFSFVLLIGAGLMVRSFIQLSHVNPGFVPQSAYVAAIHLAGPKFDTEEQRVSLMRRILAKLESLPGVMSVAVSSSFPLDPENSHSGGPPLRFQVEGNPRPEIQQPEVHSLRSATPDYFKTLGIPILTGRGFRDSDDEKAPPVVLLNHEVATKRWGNMEDPIGKRISFDDGKNWLTVVGVVGDVKEFGLQLDAPHQVFIPMTQRAFLGCVLLRTTGDPTAMTSMVHNALQEVEPRMAISREQTMEQVRIDSVSSPRTLARLFTLFAGLALLIAAAGIGSMLALWVRQRIHEIGIRMALGASPGQILGSVIRQGMVLVIAGLAAGLVVAFAVTRVLKTVLFQVKHTDAATYVLVSSLFLLAAIIACYVPARRASQIDPQSALRCE